MLENFRLKVFRTVAGHLSFRKAGETLYLTQPAVTLQIKMLEEELGTRLFERSASGVTLTEAGQTLLEFANRLSELAEQAEDRLAKQKGEAAGELFLGASTTIAQYILPSLLAAFARKYPGIHLRVASENTEHIAEGVASGRFGLGLIEGPPLRRDLKTEAWFDDELVIVAPASHEWAGTSTILAEQLINVPLVVRERGSGSRHVVEKGLQKAGLRLSSLKIVMELDSTEAILSCIEAGLGIGFASIWAVDRQGRQSTLSKIRIRDHPIERTLSFVMPPGPTLSSSAEVMMRFLQGSASSTKAFGQRTKGMTR
jgi:LysR family transcriptional regulator, transcriptional activator of the cysJI operon